MCMNTDEIKLKERINIESDYRRKGSAKLQRELMEAEKEMFQVPKACAVCHRQDKLAACTYCASTSFCDKHTSVAYMPHVKNCFMKNVFCLDKFELPFPNAPIRHSYFNYCPEETFPANMWNFINTFVKITHHNNVYADDGTDLTHLSKLKHSDEITEPLTLHFIMRKMRCSTFSRLTVHIITASKNVEENISMWNMLFDIVPSLKSMYMILVGINLKENVFYTDKYHTKKKRDLTFHVEFYKMSYYAYMNIEGFQTPNFLIGFNAISYDRNIADVEYTEVMRLMESAETLSAQSCRFILLYDAHPPDAVMKKIEKNTKKLECQFYGQNRFGICI